MPFFESAKVFEITKDNFIDVKGSRDNYHPGQSNYLGRSSSSVHRLKDNTTSGSVSVIGHGSNAKVVLDRNAMCLSSSPTPSHSPLRQSSAMSFSHGHPTIPNKTVNIDQRTPSPNLLQPDRPLFCPPTPSQQPSRAASPSIAALVVTPPPILPATEPTSPPPTSPHSPGEPKSSPTSPTTEPNQEEERPGRWRKLKLVLKLIVNFGMKSPKAKPDSKV